MYGMDVGRVVYKDFIVFAMKCDYALLSKLRLLLSLIILA